MKSQKILLWGWFGFENLGDDLLLNTMLENLSPYSGTITVPMRSQYDIKYQNVKQSRLSEITQHCLEKSPTMIC